MRDVGIKAGMKCAQILSGTVFAAASCLASARPMHRQAIAMCRTLCTLNLDTVAARPR
jgi:hypothetical protein